VSDSPVASRYRWLVLAVFVLSTAINILDRATLSALAPVLKQEFRLNNEQFGWITSAFNLTYAASAPFAGMLIDRFGLNRAISLAVAMWSCAGIATGFTRGLAGLVGCRAMLGIAEAAGIPAAGKAIHKYLLPGERALGNGVNQAGVSLGQIVAPVLATWIVVRSGWRQAFVLTGLFGLVWIPLWLWASRRAPAAESPKQHAAAAAGMLRDSRLWAFVAANALSMMGYFLWFNWTTLYMVDSHGLTLQQAVWYVWIPPVFAAAGGFAGGWLSLGIIRRGISAPSARFRVCLAASLLFLLTLAIPWAPSPAWTSAGISVSILAVAAFSVNMYTLPLDVFGAAPAGFAIAALVSSYGFISAVIAPIVGRVIDHYGYTPVIDAVAFTPLAACAVLWFTRSTR
jgi:ACS family hexuronate transporter-like MFS transporter